MQINAYNFTDGQNSGLSPMLVPPTALMRLRNCRTNLKLGSIIKDVGYGRQGANVPENGKDITGLFYSQANQRWYATMNDAGDADTQLFYLDPSDNTWKEIPDAETAWALRPNMKIEMVDFINYTFIVGHGPTGFIPSSSLTGVTFSTSTNVNLMPRGKFITVFKDRVFVCGVQGNEQRCVFSDIPVAGAITWNPAANFLDTWTFDKVTGVGVNFNRLYIFTAKDTFFYDQEKIDQAWRRGCVAHRTIKSTTNYLLWADQDGVWVSTGGSPQNVSGPVDDLIRGAVNPAGFFAEIWGEEYWLYLGQVIIGEEVYENLIVIWDSGKNTWWIRNLATDITALAANFLSNGKQDLFMGAKGSGRIWRKSSFYDQSPLFADAVDGTSRKTIEAEFITAPIPTNDPTLKAKIDKIIAYAFKGQALNVYGRWLNSNSVVTMNWEYLGQITGYNTKLELKKPIGTMIQLRFIESSQNEPFEYYGHSLDVSLDSPL